MIRYGATVAAFLLPIAATALAQPSDPPRWMANISRHHRVVLQGVPRPYTAVRDPLPDTPAKLRRGTEVFGRHCAACHGLEGGGMGPAGYELVPAPADLEWLVQAPRSTAEPYMYWSIAEGGQLFGSEMPAFKKTLSRRDIWAVIAYIRSGQSFRRNPTR
jgi:mono/diheme cytochrome c family protein